MAKSRPDRPSLSEAEWAVIKVLWEFGPMASRDVYARLAQERAWAYSTVKTLLRRMTAKGWIEYRQVGNSFLYRAAVPRARAVKSAVREFADRVLDGVLAPFVAYFAEDRRLSQEDLAQLEDLIRRQRGQKGK